VHEIEVNRGKHTKRVFMRENTLPL
jgi:hypothetical protein